MTALPIFDEPLNGLLPDLFVFSADSPDNIDLLSDLSSESAVTAGTIFNLNRVLVIS